MKNGRTGKKERNGGNEGRKQSRKSRILIIMKTQTGKA